MLVQLTGTAKSSNQPLLIFMFFPECLSLPVLRSFGVTVCRGGTSLLNTGSVALSCVRAD